MVLIASPACFSHPQPLTYRIEFDYNWLLKSVGRTGKRSQTIRTAICRQIPGCLAGLARVERNPEMSYRRNLHKSHMNPSPLTVNSCLAGVMAEECRVLLRR